MTVTEYLAQCAGTRNWVCAAALHPALVKEGYTRAVPYDKLRRWLRKIPKDVCGEPCVHVAAPYGDEPVKKKLPRHTVDELEEKLWETVKRTGSLTFDTVRRTYYSAGRVANKRVVYRLLETGWLRSNNDGLFEGMGQSWRAA